MSVAITGHRETPLRRGAFRRFRGPDQEAEGLAAGLTDGRLTGVDGLLVVVVDGLLVVELHAPSARVAPNRSRARRDFTGGVLQ